MNCLGIDPDLKGGLCLVDTEEKCILAMRHIPVRPDKKGFRLDAPVLAEWLSTNRQQFGIDVIALETHVSRAGPNRPNAGGGKAHQTYGAVRALCEVLVPKATLILAWPSAWKKKVGITADKDTSRAKALEVFPDYHRIWAVKRSHGLSEAALLAIWAVTS